MEGVRCRQCGMINDVVALTCKTCSQPLVDESSPNWTHVDQSSILSSEGSMHRARPTGIWYYLALLAALSMVCIVLLAGVNYVRDNVYIGEEPTYQKFPMSHWVEMLGSDDHYLRRRAAQILDGKSHEFKKPTVVLVVPALRRALDDEDEVVRQHAKNALDKIQQNYEIEEIE